VLGAILLGSEIGELGFIPPAAMPPGTREFLAIAQSNVNRNRPFWVDSGPPRNRLVNFVKRDIRDEIRPKVLRPTRWPRPALSRTSVTVTIKAVVFDAYGTLYDIQSVAAVTEEAFPGYGEMVTQVWRIKQLEYTWLRSLMRRYEDFSVITRESLAYTLRILGLKHDQAAFERIMDKYLHLDLYPDALTTLAALKDRKLAILSNGSTGMLNALVANSGLDRVLDATISIDSRKIFKPAPDAYTLIETILMVPPSDVLFVSSNPWDACGARAFGLNVTWIERVSPEAMAQACIKSDLIAPLTMFKAIRTQMDELGLEPNYRIHALSELPGLVHEP
jgi:2-haloacid dehalogenase